MKRSLFLAGVVASALLGPLSAHAQVQRSGSDTARVQQQLQLLSAEREQLRAENETMKKEIEALKASTAELTAANAKLQARSRQLEGAGSAATRNANAETTKELEAQRAQMQQLVTKFRETAQTLRDVETERDALRASQGTMKRDLSGCVDKNAQMYLVSTEILDRLTKKGGWNSAAELDVFTQLSRTRLENLAEDYRYRIDELKVQATAKAAAP